MVIPPLFAPSLPVEASTRSFHANKSVRPHLRHIRPARRCAKASLTTPARYSDDTPLVAESPTPSQRAVTLYDVVVIGGGPAGLSLSAALATRGVKIACLDASIDRPWPNHYGVWADEFERVGLEECATNVYDTTAVYSSDEKTVLNRPYIRVDRVKLKNRLVSRCLDNGVRIEKAFVRDVSHVSDQQSVVAFAPVSGKLAADGADLRDEFVVCRQEGQLRARLVVDCTGHALQFTDVKSAAAFRKPWEQAAYGIEAEVVSHPYQTDEMLLMDFRDAHMRTEESLGEVSERQPTFLYVFPTDEKRAFFEETSVIAPTAVSFDDLKERLYRRLDADGVKITKVIEEEFSLIPMGGSLPVTGQRTVGFGGAACLVHPATGYMVARTVRMAEEVAKTIADGLERVGDSGEVMEVSQAVWDCTWSLSLRRQRDFLDFGAELLGVLTMDESRRFFKAFFDLPQELWSRFLSFELNTAGDRIYFALYFFAIASNPIRVSLLRGIVEIGKWKLIRSVLPLWMSSGEES